MSRRSGREQLSQLEDFVSDGGTLASSLFSGSPTMRSINLNLQNRDITTNKILRASLTFKGSPLSQICFIFMGWVAVGYISLQKKGVLWGKIHKWIEINGGLQIFSGTPLLILFSSYLQDLISKGLKWIFKLLREGWIVELTFPGFAQSTKFWIRSYQHGAFSWRPQVLLTDIFHFSLVCAQNFNTLFQHGRHLLKKLSWMDHCWTGLWFYFSCSDLTI